MKWFCSGFCEKISEFNEVNESVSECVQLIELSFKPA